MSKVRLHRPLAVGMFAMVFVSADVVCGIMGAGHADEPIPIVSAAMQTMFSPLVAPRRKTMGLLQRNFLEVAGQSSDLELAIVVDGTESMSDELAGIRQSVGRMLGDLGRLRTGEVRVAVVVYRDAGALSNEVQVPLDRFSADAGEIESAIESLQPMSGAPFFYELMDVGLHRAIVTLPWSEDPAVAKWVMLFADAPPYPEDYHDEKFPDAKRRFADELLVSQASRRGIQIHCVLCKSTPATSVSHEEAIANTRRVMDRLSSETGGMVLDLSYPVIREALAGASATTAPEFSKIDPITNADLAPRDASSASGDKLLRVAVLPHEAISQIDFDPDRPAAQVATALLDKLRQLPGVRLKNPLDVERQLRRMRAEGLDDKQAIRGLAARLRVDYVVWGRLQENATLTRTVAFRQRDGLPVVQVVHRGSPDGLAKVVLEAAAGASEQDPELAEFAKRVLASAESSVLQTRLADEVSTTTAVLTAIGSLEQALGQSIGSDVSNRWLERAEAAAKRAIQQEPDNPVAHWVLSNTAFNQASALFRQGATDRASKAMQESKSSLRLANNRRKELSSPFLELEIEADYQLIVRRRPDDAIKLYEEMIKTGLPPDTRRRGHWMLAGLYAGDWGATSEIASPQQARAHVVKILTEWPDSPESDQLRHWLQWDERTDRTHHNYLPKLNSVLPGLGE